jgi:CubicO group peptidase (beta-lactamase class C family)
VADFLQGMNKRHPVYAPFTTPAYSNVAFEVLGYVLENATNQSYETVVQNTIFKPLGLSHSSVSKPQHASVGVIPVGNSDWDFDLGGESA